MPQVGRTLLEEVVRGEALNASEVRILLGAANGETSPKTAERIHLSPESVKSYRKRLVAKMGAKNLTHAVAIGLAIAMINPDDINVPEE